MFNKKTCRKIGIFFMIIFLFMQQSMILVAKESENVEEENSKKLLEGKELLKYKADNKKDNEEVFINMDLEEVFSPYYANMEELSEGIRKEIEVSKEEFVVYIPSVLTQCKEFSELRKYFFPPNRSGNYFSTTVLSISMSISNTEREDVKKLYMNVKRIDSKEEYIEALKLVKEIAKEINESAKNDYEKIKLTHNYLIKYIEYEAGYQGAYDALNKGKAVCSGYAAVFQLIMDELGISCKMVANDEINHIWNCVYLEGEWYHVDVTWDDALGKEEMIDYHYFLKSKDEFLGHGDLPDYTAKNPYVRNTSKEEVKNGWKKEGEEIYYYLDDKVVTGWLYNEGRWYYFDKDGKLQDGWINKGKIQYYFGEDGVIKMLFALQERIFRQGAFWF